MSGLLRPALLDGVTVLLAAAVKPPPSGLRQDLEALGASLVEFAPALDENGEGGADWVKAQGPVDALVFDGREGLAADDPEVDAVSQLLDAAWVATAAVATGAFIGAERSGRIILLSPGRGSHPMAGVAESALENLARTLSVEWARYGVTTTAIAPGSGTDPGHIANLVAFLLSPAGAYFSGTRLELGLLDG